MINYSDTLLKKILDLTEIFVSSLEKLIEIATQRQCVKDAYFISKS